MFQVCLYPFSPFIAFLVLLLEAYVLFQPQYILLAFLAFFFTFIWHHGKYLLTIIFSLKFGLYWSDFFAVLFSKATESGK